MEGRPAPTHSSLDIFPSQPLRHCPPELVLSMESCLQRCSSSGRVDSYLRFYNEGRLHQALDYRTPAEVYWAGKRST